MYESFFRLKSRPFQAAPRVERYFPAPAIENARQTLTRIIERAEGPGMLVGPAGTGKTLLCQVLAEQFRKTFQVVHFHSTRLCTRRALLQAILYELELPYREMAEGELRLSLIEHLTAGVCAKPNLLFIVDEAHTLPLRLLDEIRMTTNLLRDGQPPVRLILAGAPALDERFAHPKLESFNQRVAARCYLESFDHHHTYQYVCAQIAASGGQAHDLFADDAFAAIYRATDGVPRLVNQLCDHVLLLAHAGGVERIDAAGVEEAWADLQQLPLPWSKSAKAAPEPHSVIEFGRLDEPTPPKSSPAPISFVTESEDWDDDFQPVPFPQRSSGDEALEHLAQIEQQLAELEEDEFRPVGSIGPQIELRFSSAPNPFSESFEEEEVVIDRYAMLDDSLLQGRPRVANRGGDQLAEQLKQHELTQPPRAAAPPQREREPMRIVEEVEAVEFDAVLPEEPIEAAPRRPAAAIHSPAAPAGPHVATSAAVDDRDLILIEEDGDPMRPAPRVRRHDYRQLFAKLRQS